MNEYFPEPKSLGGRVKVKSDLCNYATKVDFKNATGVDKSKFANKVDLANLESNVDKLDIDKLKNVPTNLSNIKSKIEKLVVNKLVSAPADLSKLSNAVKNDVVQKDAYNAQIKNIQDKILDISNLPANSSLNAKINEVKGEIHNISNLATTTTALAAVENEIPNVSNLVEKQTITQKLVKMKMKLLLILIMINILLFKSLVSQQDKILMQG